MTDDCFFRHLVGHLAGLAQTVHISLHLVVGYILQRPVFSFFMIVFLYIFLFQIRDHTNFGSYWLAVYIHPWCGVPTAYQ